MDKLYPLADRIAVHLTARKQSIAVCESSTAGLLSAALLSVPGASAYFLGGVVTYTYTSREALLGITDDDMKRLGLRSSSEPYAAYAAERVREKHGAIWGLAETGAAGPTGNRYGDPAGHTAIAIVGPRKRTLSIKTGKSGRRENMMLFAEAALKALIAELEA
jgi:nicotinamide-nucleotide amidase